MKPTFWCNMVQKSTIKETQSHTQLHVMGMKQIVIRYLTIKLQNSTDGGSLTTQPSTMIRLLFNLIQMFNYSKSIDTQRKCSLFFTDVVDLSDESGSVVNLSSHLHEYGKNYLMDKGSFILIRVETSKYNKFVLRSFITTSLIDLVFIRRQMSAIY